MNEHQKPDQATNQQQPDRATNQQQHPDGETSTRLLGVLHDLVDDVGPGKTAALLGVDRKTLWRVLKEGRLTPRLVRTVERQARTPAGQNAARHRVRRDALERRVGALERELPERIEELRGEVEALAAQAEARVREPIEPLAQERPQDRGGPAGTDTDLTGAGAQEPTRTRAVAPEGARAAVPPLVRGVAHQPVIGERRVTKPRRDHPELVTLERETGEEFVYGDATPLVVEWRGARAAFLGADGSRVERASGWVRMCELELVLVGVHELTLPPDTYPWDAFRREEEMWRRRRSLRNAHRERRRALRWCFLRRLFTLGLRPR